MKAITSLFLLCSIVLPTAGAQGLSALSVEEVIDTRVLGEISPLAISPDGRFVAYMVRDTRRIRTEEEQSLEVQTGVPDRDEDGDIWLSNTETGKSRNLTGGIGSSWDPVWSPDGRHLAFLSERGNRNQARIWVWDSAKNSLNLASDRVVREVRFCGIQWTPDSRKLIITAIPNNLSPEGYAKAALSPGNGRDSSIPPSLGSTVKLYESFPDISDTKPAAAVPLGNLDANYLRDLILIDVASKRDSTLVHGDRIGWYLLSPDGSHLAYSSPKRFAKSGSYQKVYDLAAVDLKTGKKLNLVADTLLTGGFTWSPDGSLICFAAVDGQNDATDRYYLVQVNGRKIRGLSPSARHVLSGGFSEIPLWDPKGEHIYFLRDGGLWWSSIADGDTREIARITGHRITHRIALSANELFTQDEGQTTVVVAHDESRKDDGFYKIDLVTGAWKRLLNQGECYTCKVGIDLASYDIAVSRGTRRLVYSAEGARLAPDLWITDSNFQTARQLTRMNPQFDADKLGSAQLLDWLSDDGKAMHGALLLPPDYVAGRKYPLLVYVYPGVRASDTFDRFGLGEFPGPLNMQLFSTRGYAVMLPDSEDSVGDRVGGLVKSVLPGVNKVVEQGIADPGRVAVMGHSQGGYATLVLITQTTRFRAAVEIAGWSDFMGFFGYMKADGTGFQYAQTERQLGGAPWQCPVRYIQNSPLFYLDRVDTPLLAVQGANDDAVPSFLGDEVFVGLRRLGKTVEYARYEGATHSPRDWTRANQVDLAYRLIGWLDQYLKGDLQ